MENLTKKNHQTLLSDPFLQLPTENTIRVVWFTEFQGQNHQVAYGEKLHQYTQATTKKMSQLREDIGDNGVRIRDIWRQEAVISGLIPQQKIPYQVISINNQGATIKSRIFHLSPSPKPHTPLKILLTSDHQLKPLTAANLQKVVETIGQIDAIFFAGDLVNIPDKAAEWFDDISGGAFFPCLQGLANYELEKNGQKTIYHGGELIQNAPLFTAIGNHEIMGRYSHNQSLNKQFYNSFPRQQAEINYQKIAQIINPHNSPQLKEAWIKANSFNTNTYEEMFTLPESHTGGKKYYATTFGDIWLGVLYVANMWRSPNLSPDIKGRYQEREADLETPDNWGYGQHIFESIQEGSEQYQWLKQELATPAFQQAKYKIIMFHHPAHTLGGNIVPPYTQPIQILKCSDEGTITKIYYQYPLNKDYIINHLMPLLESAGVQLVFYGHSHLWNRFVSPSGLNFLESSNVGNSYGAHILDNPRPLPPDSDHLNYLLMGDPNGLKPIIPNLAPLIGEDEKPLPYIASNDITVFSILDTSKGTISSYRFDTRDPASEVLKFDEFFLAIKN